MDKKIHLYNICTHFRGLIVKFTKGLSIYKRAGSMNMRGSECYLPGCENKVTREGGDWAILRGNIC